MAHQEQQDVVFNGRQAYRLTVHGDSFGVVIQNDTADDQFAGPLLHAA